jgi:hypothetical protein
VVKEDGSIAGKKVVPEDFFSKNVNNSTCLKTTDQDATTPRRLDRIAAIMEMSPKS